MEAEEKAVELFNKMYNVDAADDYNDSEISYEHAKKCALIAVDEIIKANPHSNLFNTDVSSTMAYWNGVRKEIENL